LQINVQQVDIHYCGFAIIDFVKLSPTEVIGIRNRGERVLRIKAKTCYSASCTGVSGKCKECEKWIGFTDVIVTSPAD